MNNWEILGIPETGDLREVKKAYARQSKIYHPETHPDEFKKLHTAYKTIVNRLTSGLRMNQEFCPPVIQKQSEEEDTNVKRSWKQSLKSSEPKQKAVQQDDFAEAAAFLALVESASSAKLEEQYQDLHLEEFEKLMETERYQEGWKRYFTSPEFLENQYHPEYISGITSIIEAQLRKPVKKMGDGGGRIPQFAFIYLIITYGCMFDKIGRLEVTEHVYRRGSIADLEKTLRLYDGSFFTYLMIEQRKELLGERYAFYVYRHILELLETSNPDREKLREWLVDGFMKENRSHLLDITYHSPYSGVTIMWDIRRTFASISRSPVFFELMIFLVSGKKSVSAVFREVLREVCHMPRSNDDDSDEIILLKMMLEEKQ